METAADHSQPLSPLYKPGDPALNAPPDPLAPRFADLERREALLTEREKQVTAAIEMNHLQQSRLDDNYIKAQIVSEHFICAIDAYRDDPNITEDGRRALESLTIGVFVLRNGFIVTGEGLAESPGNYDSKVDLRQLGRRLRHACRSARK